MHTQKISFPAFFAGLFALITALFSTHAAADAAKLKNVEFGPAIGAIIPHELNLNDQSGAAQSFDSLVGENGMALFFVRSFDWCPFCQRQALDIATHTEKFEERGLSVVFVSYDSQKKLAKFKKKHGFALPMLSDKNIEAIGAFDIINPVYSDPKGNNYGVPHPVVFIISPQKEILAKFHQDDLMTNKKSYRNRPPATEILSGADAAFAMRAKSPQ